MWLRLASHRLLVVSRIWFLIKYTARVTSLHLISTNIYFFLFLFSYFRTLSKLLVRFNWKASESKIYKMLVCFYLSPEPLYRLCVCFQAGVSILVDNESYWLQVFFYLIGKVTKYEFLYHDNGYQKIRKLLTGNCFLLLTFNLK